MPGAGKLELGDSKLSEYCQYQSAGVLVHGPDGRILSANRAACEILGMAAADLTGYAFPGPGIRATNEDGRPLPESELPPARAIATGKPCLHMTVGLIAPAWQGPRWVLVDANPVFDEASGHIREAVTTLSDISEFRRAAEALRQSEERFRSLVETSHDWVWQVDENFVYTYSSPRVRDLLGYEAEEVIGKAPFDLMPPEEAARIRKALEQVRAEHKPIVALENVNLHKSGRRVILETSGVPFFDDSGRFAGYRGIDRDITQRKAAEEALREREAFISRIMDLLPSRLAYVDSQRRYRFVNRRCEEWFGKPREAIVGRHAKEVVGEEVYSEASPYVEAALSGRGVCYEMEMRRPSDGEMRSIAITYTPHFDENGRVPGFFSFIEDTTDRKRLEEQLRQAQKMEAVGTLAGGMAHDFNNLLMVIAGYSSLIREELEPGSRFEPELRAIERAAKRAAWLTQQLLAFSRKQVLQPKVLDLNAIIRGLEPAIRRALGEHIALALELAPSSVRVKADPGHMQRAVMNLVSNARDAMPRGGKLTIRTRVSEIDAAESNRVGGVSPGRYFLIELVDTGHGMDTETARRAFDPFFTTKRTEKARGLGLSTAYGVVKQSGGHITVDSHPGAGSRFVIYLPVATGRSK
jgi:two-component system cell cycle sensor histidine kinase/response regulator CckA